MEASSAMIKRSMSEQRLSERTIRVEITRLAAPWSASTPEYALAARAETSGASGNGRVLVMLDAVASGVVEVDAGRALEIPADTSSEAALAAPLVAEALRAWDLLGLELGAAAVVTDGLPWSPLVASVARCYGAIPTVAGGNATGGERILAWDAESVAAFAKTLKPYPAVCAIELSGRADSVDLLLEAVPRDTRMLFAGPGQDRLTIDYYVNVHRKGLHLSSTVLSARQAFSGAASDQHRVQRALRLLASPTRAAGCLEAISRARSMG